VSDDAKRADERALGPECETREDPSRLDRQHAGERIERG
jgi:hypothetical protein